MTKRKKVQKIKYQQQSTTQ